MGRVRPVDSPGSTFSRTLPKTARLKDEKLSEETYTAPEKSECHDRQYCSTLDCISCFLARMSPSTNLSVGFAFLFTTHHNYSIVSYLEEP